MTQNSFTNVDSAEQLATETGLDIGVATAIVDVIDRREEHSGRRDMLVRVSDWLAEQWTRDHGPATGWMLVRDVTDYSQKAWTVEGAFHLTEKVLNPETCMDLTLTEAVQSLDHSTKEYPRDAGFTFLPKSQTVSIISLIPTEATQYM